jgi:hypothetical protein
VGFHKCIFPGGNSFGHDLGETELGILRERRTDQPSVRDNEEVLQVRSALGHNLLFSFTGVHQRRLPLTGLLENIVLLESILPVQSRPFPDKLPVTAQSNLLGVHIFQNNSDLVVHCHLDFYCLLCD